jgi:16S rRNA (uracil1498-N3)-methyltransferase
MATHRIYLPTDPSDTTPQAVRAGVTVSVTGEEAHHALRVKRLETGDPVEVCDGAGMVADGTIRRTAKVRQEWTLDIEIRNVTKLAPSRPRFEVWSAVPKGEHLEILIDMLSQIGVDLWRPLECERAEVEPRAGKLERMQRRATEAMKQCGRAWVMGIGESAAFGESLTSARVIMADASGSALREEALRSQTIEVVRLIVGPEGGWTQKELDLAAGAGATTARFGPHIMRIETACLVGAGVLVGMLSPETA